MPKAGTYTALQKLKPISADFGRDAREEEQLAFKYREEKTKRDEKAQAEKDKITYNALGQVKTGIESLDMALYNGISQIDKTNYEDWKRARNNPSYANSDEYKVKSANRKDYVKNLKIFTDEYKKFADKITAMGGNLAGWNEDLRSQIGGYFVKERVEFGENDLGQPIARIAQHDPNAEDGYKRGEDGEVIMKEVSLPEILKGLGDYHIVPEVDITGQAQALGEKLGKDVKSKREGFTITEEQLWENKKEDAMSLVKAELGSVKNPTDLAKRLWADEEGRTKDNWDENAFNTVADEFLELVKPYYDEERKLSYNYAGLNQELGRKSKESTKNNVIPVVVPDETTGTVKTVTIPGTDKTGYAVSFGDGVLTGKSESRVTFIKNIYFDESTGEIYAEKTVSNKKIGDPIRFEDGSIDYLSSMMQGKGWEVSEEGTSKLSSVDFTNLAKNEALRKEDGSRFKDGKELKDYLNDQLKSMKKEFRFDGTGGKKTGASRFNKK